MPRFHIARGALSLPEGAEIVSRAAARLCERPRSPPTRAPAPAGPENQCAPTAGRSCAPPGAGRCFWRDRWRRSRGSLADRLAIGGPAGPGRQGRASRARQAGPRIQGRAGRTSFSGKGSRTFDGFGGRGVQKIGPLPLFERPDESGAGILPAWAREAGCLRHFQAGREARASKLSSGATAIQGSCQCTKCPVSLPRSSHPPKLARSREGRVD
jgi:hypothetical protein